MNNKIGYIAARRTLPHSRSKLRVSAVVADFTSHWGCNERWYIKGYIDGIGDNDSFICPCIEQRSYTDVRQQGRRRSCTALILTNDFDGIPADIQIVASEHYSPSFMSLWVDWLSSVQQWIGLRKG